MNKNRNIIIKLVPELRLFPYKYNIQYTSEIIDYTFMGWLFIEIIIDRNFDGRLRIRI